MSELIFADQVKIGDRIRKPKSKYSFSKEDRRPWFVVADLRVHKYTSMTDPYGESGPVQTTIHFIGIEDDGTNLSEDFSLHNTVEIDRVNKRKDYRALARKYRSLLGADYARMTSASQVKLSGGWPHQLERDLNLFDLTFGDLNDL